MKLGTAKLPITPNRPLRLSGYASRLTPFESVREDIFLRVHHYEHDSETLLFIYGDVLWWGSDFVESVRPALAKKYGIQPERIFFFASHNHSGPPTGNAFIPLLETYDEEYDIFLRTRVDEGVGLALGNLEEVRVKRFGGMCDLNVYRRKMVDGRIEMLPEYSVPADKKLAVIEFRRGDGGLKGCLVHYPCHANISDRNYVQPDFPGVTLRMMDEAYPESVSLYLQGCTADLRPNSALGGRFSARGYEEVLIFAGDLFHRCRDLMAGTGWELAPAFHTADISVELVLENLKPQEALQELLMARDEAIRQWAEKVLSKGNRDREILTLSRIAFADRLEFFTFGAEVSQYYAEFASSLNPDTLCVSCANGMTGYVSTARQIAEGGYEPAGSARYFALSGTFSPRIESDIQEAMKKLGMHL